MTAAALAQPVRHAERWRPAFRGYQRMRIIEVGSGEYEIEAELDGAIAVGFTRWRDADAFLAGIQERQREVFL